MKDSSLMAVAGLLGLASVFARAKDSDFPPGVDASLPAFPAQLPAGSRTGTFRYSEPVLVKFSQRPEFPVDLVLRNYAHREVFRKRIDHSDVEVVSCDLAPGSYDQIYEMIGRSRKDYCDFENAPGISISEQGLTGTWTGSKFQPVSFPAYVGRVPYNIFIPRKIALIQPNDHAVITGDKITFSWLPIPGVSQYEIYICPIEDKNHPNSEFPAEHKIFVAKDNHCTLKVGLGESQLYLHDGESYIWCVKDSGSDLGSSSGHIAQSAIRIFTRGGSAEMEGERNKDFIRDETIISRLKIRLQQPYISTDGGDGIGTVDILAIGAGSPFLAAGMGPGTRVASIDGVKTPTLTEFQKCLEAIPSGKVVQVGVPVYDTKQKKMMIESHPMVMP